MNNNWPRRRFGRIFRRRAVLQIEAFRELEIELNGGTLEGPAQGIPDGDVYLRAVECAIARINFPLSGIEFLE
jgi:hypothetical protein